MRRRLRRRRYSDPSGLAPEQSNFFGANWSDLVGFSWIERGGMNLQASPSKPSWGVKTISLIVEKVAEAAFPGTG
jgi:hypothetical protein